MRPFTKLFPGIARTALAMPAFLTVLMLCCVFIAPPVMAEEQSVSIPAEKKPATEQVSAKGVSDKTTPEKTSSGAYIMQLVMSLVVVLVAIAVLAWLMKRLNRLPKGSAGNMQVLGAMALGARERAILVQVGETQMLLGVSPGRVSTLHVFSEPVVDADSVGGPATNFASILNSLGKGGGRQ